MPPVQYHAGRFPPTALDWPHLIPLIGPAAAAVARYDGVLSAMPNPDVLLAPLTMQEAVLSSRIEGTQATIGEVLEFEATEGALSPEKRHDVREVLNYRAAMRKAEQLLGNCRCHSGLSAKHTECCWPADGAGTGRPASTAGFPPGSVLQDARSKTPISSQSARTSYRGEWISGNGISMQWSRIASCSLQFCTLSSRRCTRSSMGMAAWEGCWCRCSCGRRT